MSVRCWCCCYRLHSPRARLTNKLMWKFESFRFYVHFWFCFCFQFRHVFSPRVCVVVVESRRSVYLSIKAYNQQCYAFRSHRRIKLNIQSQCSVAHSRMQINGAPSNESHAHSHSQIHRPAHDTYECLWEMSKTNCNVLYPLPKIINIRNDECVVFFCRERVSCYCLAATDILMNRMVLKNWSCWLCWMLILCVCMYIVVSF